MTCASHQRELILYATPTGPLAGDLDHYFASATTTLGPTEAQAYPPHISLTGFFHRAPDRAGEIGDEVRKLLDECGPMPPDAVTISGLVCDEHWVGLSIDSPWLLDLTNKFIHRHRLGPNDDALRPKTWLHLSLAYGVRAEFGQAIDRYAVLADDLVDPASAAVWGVALWERRSEAEGKRWYRRS